MQYNHWFEKDTTSFEWNTILPKMLKTGEFFQFMVIVHQMSEYGDAYYCCRIEVNDEEIAVEDRYYLVNSSDGEVIDFMTADRLMLIKV